MPIGVLFVCMGNICRSPSAEGVFRHMVNQAGLDSEIIIDSAGTHQYHIGNPPDTRSQVHALKRGFDLSALKARHVVLEDFEQFDYILAMDRDNLALLQRQCPKQYQEKLQLFLALAPELSVDEVPDPYYGGVDGFETVLDLIETASERLLGMIIRDFALTSSQSQSKRS